MQWEEILKKKTVNQMEKSEKCEHGIENFELFLTLATKTIFSRNTTI